MIWPSTDNDDNPVIGHREKKEMKRNITKRMVKPKSKYCSKREKNPLDGRAGRRKMFMEVGWISSTWEVSNQSSNQNIERWLRNAKMGKNWSRWRWHSERTPKSKTKRNKAELSHKKKVATKFVEPLLSCRVRPISLSTSCYLSCTVSASVFWPGRLWKIHFALVIVLFGAAFSYLFVLKTIVLPFCSFYTFFLFWSFLFGDSIRLH